MQGWQICKAAPPKQKGWDGRSFLPSRAWFWPTLSSPVNKLPTGSSGPLLKCWLKSEGKNLENILAIAFVDQTRRIKRQKRGLARPQVTDSLAVPETASVDAYWC